WVFDRFYRLGRRRLPGDSAFRLARALEPLQISAPVVSFGFGLQRHLLKLIIGESSFEYALYLSSQRRIHYCELEGARVRTSRVVQILGGFAIGRNFVLACGFALGLGR